MSNRAWIVAFALVAAACAPAPSTVPAGVQLACSPNGLVRFDASFLQGPHFTTLEFEVTTEPGRALRSFVRDAGELPLYDGAEGFSIVSDTLVLAYRDRIPTAFFFLEGDRVLDWGPCRPSLVDGARFAVRWRPAGPLEPEASTVRIRADAPRCTTPDGTPSPSKVAAVDVDEGRDTVTIVVWFREPPRGSCLPDGGRVDTVVQLSGPLGDRVLLDGGTFPPSAPVSAADT